ncbi:MAG TPA: tetratricopeptide repeat protein, partial [Anaerolineae bacterium]|nr:tetratricopeptide repeat protein [Anaerolineae bacterium]
PTPPPTLAPPPATLLADAARAMHDGDYASGIAEYRAALAGSPAPDEIEEAQLGLGTAALRGGDQVLAENTLTQFIAAHPESGRLADAWFWLGDTRYASGNFTGAADAYREYLTLRGDVIESYVQERIGDAYDQAGDTQAAGESYRRAIVVAPNTSIAARQREKLAMLLRLSGNHAAAIEEYRAILAFAQVPAYRAHVMQLLGQALIDSGDASGYDVLLELVSAYPRAGDAYQALVTLIENGIPVDQFQRGLVDFYAGQYDAAVAAFDNFIPAARDPSEALYYSGLSYRAAGNPLAAITQFDAIIRRYPKSQRWSQAWIDKAIAQANGGDLETAIGSLVKFVSEQPAAALAPNALLQAGLLLERAGEYGRAAETYRALQADYPLHESAPNALFAAGINAFRATDATSAIDAWRMLSDTYPSAGFYPAALLWQGKLGLNVGSKQARGLLDLAAQAEPFGYYGIRAAELRDNLPTLQPGRFRLDFDEAAERGDAERWLAQWTGHPGQAGKLAPGILDDNRFRRGAELWRLGWTDQAKDEFENLRAAHTDDPIGLYALSLYWRDIGLYRSSLKSAARLLALSPAQTAAEAPAFIARLAYPIYYADLVIPEAEAYGLDPLLMFALIRQESEFESIATSSAFANGLMQIIPATGREIAEALGWPDYSTSDLYRPYVSVKFGTFYLARHGRDFLDGDMYAALAAYNGGPGNAARWRELANGDPDLFLEAITLNETRTYLIRIREHLAIYQLLYGEQ